MKIKYLNEEERLVFFDNVFMEQKFYLVASNLSENYNGGYWELAIAENGAKIVFLRSDESFTPNYDYFFSYDVDEKINSKIFSAWAWLKFLEASFYNKDGSENDDMIKMFIKAKDCYLDNDIDTQILNEYERYQLYSLLD